MKKRCSTCKQIKSTSEFFVNNNHRDGLCYYCKACKRKFLDNLPPWNKTYLSISNRCSFYGSTYYKKGIKNLITREELKSLWFRDKAYLMEKPSIDRIDSNKHYTLENCRYIEYAENIKLGGKVVRSPCGVDNGKDSERRRLYLQSPKYKARRAMERKQRLATMYY